MPPKLAPLGGLSFQTDKPKPQAKPKRSEKPKVKIDPQLVAKARELRDRRMDRVARGARTTWAGRCGTTIAPRLMLPAA